MFDVATRIFNTLMAKLITYPVVNAVEYVARSPLHYRNIYNSLDTNAGRMIMPFLFPIVLVLYVARNLLIAAIGTVLMIPFFFTHFLTIGLFGEHAAKLPWIQYSTSIDGPNAKDVDFLREFFNVMHIEMFSVWVFLGHQLFIIKVVDDNNINSYVVYTSVEDLNEHLIKIQSILDKQKEIV